MIDLKNSLNIGKVGKGLSGAKNIGKLLNQGANSLNTENNKAEEGGGIDPSKFLKGSELRAWRNLNNSKKKEILKKASASQTKLNAQNNLLKTNNKQYLQAKNNASLQNSRLSRNAANEMGRLVKSAANASAKVATKSATTAVKYSNPYTAAADTAKKSADIFKKSLSASQQIDTKSQANRIFDEQGSTLSIGGGFTSNFTGGKKKGFFSLFTSFVSLKLLLAAIILAIPIIIASIFSTLISSFEEESSGDAKIVKVANGELNQSGSKYWDFTMGSKFVNGDATPWCACFVSWCANECEYIESDIFPKSGAVSSYMNFYQSRHLYYSKDSYTPKTADLIFFSPSHIGIVEKVEDVFVYTIEGNNSDSVRKMKYPLSSSYIVGYATPQYPAEDLSGKDVEIPEGMSDGSVTCTNYNYFFPKWSKSSRQRVVADYWDARGRKQSSGHIAMIDDYYLIACTTTFGEVGDIVVFTFNDNTTMKCIMADAKRTNNAEEGSNAYGHNGGKNVIEIEYCGSPNNASDVNNNAHPEFCKPVIRGSNLGKYSAFR